MSRAPATLLPLVVLIACGGSGGSPGTDSGTGSGSTTAGTTSDGSTGGTTTGTAGTTTSDAPTTTGTTTGAADGPTYWRDVKAIVDLKCAGCHRPGDIGPFSLTNYDEVSMFAPVFAPTIKNGTMPPWPPSAECNTFAHDRSLTDVELATILDWIDLGTPEGDPNDAPPPPEDPPTIDYDIELSIPEPFTPKTDVPDDYRCFLLDWPKDQPTYATGFTIVPGAREVVHHVIAFIIPPDELAAFEALDAADPGPGYPCYGGPGGEASPRARWLGGWAPGAKNDALPEGTGILVDPGSKIAMQLHYHTTGVEVADQSTLMVRTAEAVDRPAFLLPIAHPGWMVDAPAMTIPAGEADVMHSFTIDLGSVLGYLYQDDAIGIGQPMQAHMAGVHMHTRGTRASVVVQRDGGGEECLIDVPRWDFGWQGVYDFSAPITVGPSDLVRLECHFDNSKGDASLKWGESTDDEMCLGMVYVSVEPE